MSSKLLRKGSELYGKKKEDADQGLKAAWAGSADTGLTPIAAVSKGRQYKGVDGGSMHRRAAPKLSWAPKAVATDQTGAGFKENHTESPGGFGSRAGGANFNGIRSKVGPRV